MHNDDLTGIVAQGRCRLNNERSKDMIITHPFILRPDPAALGLALSPLSSWLVAVAHTPWFAAGTANVAYACALA
jgi:hypothetical protein